jgi:hypothetical protein
MERLAGHLTHARQGEQVVALRERPYQNGYPVDDLAWYCRAYEVEAGETRLETMRQLVLYLAVQEPLVLSAPEQQTRARQHVVLVGSKKALAIAVRNGPKHDGGARNDPAVGAQASAPALAQPLHRGGRYTGLAVRLRQLRG